MEDIRFDDIDRLKSKISDQFSGWSEPIEITHSPAFSTTLHSAERAALPSSTLMSIPAFRSRCLLRGQEPVAKESGGAPFSG